MTNLILLLCSPSCCEILITAGKTNINWGNLISALIIFVGWFAVHYFSKKRDSKNKKREIILEYLIKTLRILANDINKRPFDTPEIKRIVEEVITDMQLFGSVKQVKMAKDLAVELASEGITELNPLVRSLRDSLRDELELKKVKGDIQWLRFK